MALPPEPIGEVLPPPAWGGEAEVGELISQCTRLCASLVGAEACGATLALPPEPVEDVLPRAVWVVEAEVGEIISQGTALKVEAPAGYTGVNRKAGMQVLTLGIKRVLRGPD